MNRRASGLRIATAFVALVISAWVLAQSNSAFELHPRKRALVIGVGSYTDLPRLDYAVADAELFKSILTGHLGFSEGDIVVLTDGARSKTRPTAGVILGEIEDFASNPAYTASDLFVFYFAGHGISAKGEDYLLPSDARTSTATTLGVPVRKLVERISELGLKNVLIVVDACRTGDSKDFGSEIRQLCKSANIGLLLSTKPGATSREVPELGQGLFTYALSAAFEEKELHADSTGCVWLSGMAKVVRDKAIALSAKYISGEPQEPQSYTDEVFDLLVSVSPNKSWNKELAKGLAERINAMQNPSSALSAQTVGVSLIPIDLSAAYNWLHTAYTKDPSDARSALMFATVARAIGLKVTSKRVGARFKNSSSHDICTAVLQTDFGKHELSVDRQVSIIETTLSNLKPGLTDEEALWSVQLIRTFGALTEGKSDLSVTTLENLVTVLQKHTFIEPWLKLTDKFSTGQNVRWSECESLLTLACSNSNSSFVRAALVYEVTMNLLGAGSAEEVNKLLDSKLGNYLPASERWLNRLAAYWMSHMKDGESAFYDVGDEERSAVEAILPDQLSSSEFLLATDIFGVVSLAFLDELQARYDEYKSKNPIASFNDEVVDFIAFMAKYMRGVASGETPVGEFELGPYRKVERQLLPLDELEMTYRISRWVLQSWEIGRSISSSDRDRFVENSGFESYVDVLIRTLPAKARQLSDAWDGRVQHIGHDMDLWKTYLEICCVTGRVSVGLAASEYFLGQSALSQIYGHKGLREDSGDVEVAYALASTDPSAWEGILEKLPLCRIPRVFASFLSSKDGKWIDQLKRIYGFNESFDVYEVGFKWDESPLHLDYSTGYALRLLYEAGRLMSSADSKALADFKISLEEFTGKFRQEAQDPAAMVLYGYALLMSGSTKLMPMFEGIAAMPFSESSYLYPLVEEFWARTPDFVKRSAPRTVLNTLLLSNSMASAGASAKLGLFGRGEESFAGTWSEDVSVNGLTPGWVVPGKLEWRCLADGTVVGTLTYKLDGAENAEKWILEATMNGAGTVSGTLERVTGREPVRKANVFWRMPPKDSLLPESHRGLPVIINFVSEIQGVGWISAPRKSSELAGGGSELEQAA